MKHYLTEVVDAVTTIYVTPEKIVKVVEQEIIIKNPPYDTARTR